MLITVDFLEFAIKNCSLEKIIDFLNFRVVSFKDGGTFNVNYSKSKILYGFCSIGYENEKTAYDIYVRLTGSGCRLFEDLNPDRGWYDFISQLNSNFDVSFRRIDIAIDDYTGTLRTERMARYWEQRKFAGACRSVPLQYRFRSEEMIFGSTKSDYLIRVYNKGLERGFKAGQDILIETTGEIVKKWWRLEQQIRGYKAEQFIYKWLSSGSEALSEISCGYILEFIRFLTKPNDKKNSQRIPVASWWLDFLDNAKRIKFTSKPGLVYNKHKLQRFIFKQAASSIRTYIHLLGLTPEELFVRFDDEDIQLNNSQLALIRANATKIMANLQYKDKFTAAKSELPFDPVLDAQKEFIQQFIENDVEYINMEIGEFILNE